MALYTTYKGCAIQRFGGYYIASDLRGLNAKSFSKKGDAYAYIFQQIKTNTKWTFLDLKVNASSKHTNAQPSTSRAHNLTTPSLWRTKICSAFSRLWSPLQSFGCWFRAKNSR